MNQKRKIILIILGIVCIGGTALFCANDFAFADRDLELDYPTAPSDPSGDPVVTPDTTKTTLPEYIKYLFNFLIGIGGILAFAIFLYGGVMWLLSAGNPGIIGAAKKKMLNGIMGLGLLLCSYLIIYAINPDLTVMRLGLDWISDHGPEITPSELDPKLYQEIPIGLLVEDILAKNISCFDDQGNLIDCRTKEIIQGAVEEEKWPPEEPEEIPPECIPPSGAGCNACWYAHHPECWQYISPVPEPEDPEDESKLRTHHNYCYKYDDEGNKTGLNEYHDRLDCIKELMGAIEIKSAMLREASEELEIIVNEKCKCTNCNGPGDCYCDGADNCFCCGSPREEEPPSCSGNPPTPTLKNDPCTLDARETIDELRNEIFQIVNGKKQKIEGSDIVINYDYDPEIDSNFLSIREANARLKGLKEDFNKELNELKEAEELVKFPSFVKRLNLAQYLDKKILEKLKKQDFKNFSPPGYDSVARYCKEFNCSDNNNGVCDKYKLNAEGVLCNLFVLDGAPSTFYHSIKEYEKHN